jgi:hypothetical protein
MRMASGGVLAAFLLAVGVPSLAAQGTQERRGFWFGLGVGYGSMGCNGCDERSGSGSGYVALGGTLSQQVRLGFEGVGWAKKEDNATFTVGGGNAVIYFYPMENGGLHLKGGAGFASASLEVEQDDVTVSVDKTGFGWGGGLGWDVRLSRKISLTPFAGWYWQRISTDGDSVTFNFFQLGLAFVVH